MRLRTFGALAGAAALAFAFTPTVRAQGGRGMGMMGMGQNAAFRVLTTPEGEKELNLTTDQTSKLKELGENFRTDMMEKMQSLGRDASPEDRQAAMKELGDGLKKDLKGILKEEQLKRYEQINLQAMGFGAFLQPDIQTKLKMTDDQKSKLKGLQEGVQTAMREAREQNEGDFRAIGEAVQKAGESAKEKALAVLTSEQKTTWSELTGKPFKMPAMQFGGPGGGRGRRPE